VEPAADRATHNVTQAGQDRIARQPAQWHTLELSGSALDGAIDRAAALTLLGLGKPARRWLPRDRWSFLCVFLVALVIFAATDPGRIIFDTKLGVDIDAQDFLTRLWSLWNPLEWFGSLQDQYIGYAIPMAPFFLIGQLLHVPIWLTERLWLALLVAVGFTGMVKLARALGVGSEPSRLVAGAVFALWPTFTIEIGSTSAGALPGLVVPWALLPLVAAVGGRLKPGRAAALSGVAVAAMAGVNAVSTLAVLVLPALYILTHTSSRQRVELGLKWCLAVVAGTSWWLVPLLLQARYSYNFLPYIEQSSTTTGSMAAAAVLRGTGTWTAYLNLGGTPWLSAGWTIVTSPAAILGSAAAAAAGLAGLARRDMPERRWLCLCVGLTAAIALSGYYGPLGGPWHAEIDKLLDGPLSPFRSLYKFEPIIAVALALGCAHLLERCWRHSLALGGAKRIGVGAATAPLVALALVGLALPQLSGQVLQPGSFPKVPGYWYQAAAFLAAHSPRTTALVVPADPHGQFTWGDTIDDPLEPIATSPWVERGLVPYGGAGSEDLLATAEQAIDSGQEVPGLPAYLARAGIRYVVVRNDTSPSDGNYTPPQDVNESLALSGFTRVAAFGPPVQAAPGYPDVPGVTPGFATSYAAVEIFQASSPDLRPAGPAQALPVSKTVLVNGGPDALLQLAGQAGLADQPTTIAGDKLAAKPATWAVTDGQRRTDDDFGATSNYQSYPYTATQTNPPDDPLGDPGGQPRQLLPVAPVGHQTVAVLSGAASVTASSAGSWLGESPQYDPANAFDGDPATAWAEASPTTPVGQWVQIDFARVRNLPAAAGIQLLDDISTRSIANQVRVTTAAGSAVTDLAGTGSSQHLTLPPGQSRWLRVTITGASNVRGGFPGAGISDVLIPGVTVTTYLQPAEDQAGMQAPQVDYSFAQQTATPATTSGNGQLNRTFVTASGARLAAHILAVPQPGSALEALISNLSPVTRSHFAVTANSIWDGAPEFGPANLFEAGTGRPWLASAGSTSPTLQLKWRGKRKITKLILQPAYGLAAAPATVVIHSPAGNRLANVSLGGVVVVSPPLRTTRLDLSFPTSSSSAAGNTVAGQPGQLPIGLAKLTIPALAKMRLAMPRASSQFSLGCGQGPAVTVDGRRYQTSVHGTVGDLIALRPVQLQLCTQGGTLALPAGRQRLTASPSSDFAITSLSLTSETAASQGQSGQAAQARQLRVVSWQADSRELHIGQGAAAYVEIHENANPGWRATMGGKPLDAVTLDGWQQAFVVPAGAGGTITLTFSPAAAYHDGLIAAAAALLVLLAVALPTGWLWRRRRFRRAPRGHNGDSGTSRATGHGPSRLAGPPGRPALVFRPLTPADLDLYRAELAVAGHPGLAERGPGWHNPATQSRARRAGGRQQAPSRRTLHLGPWSWRTTARQALLLTPVAVVILVVGGPVVVAVPLLVLTSRLLPRSMPVVAAAAMICAGIAIASAHSPTISGSGPFSGFAQFCALVALAAALVPGRTRRTAAPTQEGPA
jgi:arabinofuranan 3-O-arabinosyltransferase